VRVPAINNREGFGLKGPKSAAQHEEDLYRKVQAADSDYSSRYRQHIVRDKSF
jgi:hypothetical protein